MTYRDAKSGLAFSGWVFGGFLSATRPVETLKPCSSLNHASMKIFKALYYETINPENGKNWPDVRNYQPQINDEFILNEAGSGVRTGSLGRDGSYDFPVHWNKEGEKIIIVGDYTFRSKPSSLEDCDYGRDKKCIENMKIKFRKEYGGDEATVHPVWEIILADKGFVQIKESSNGYPYTMEESPLRYCGY